VIAGALSSIEQTMKPIDWFLAKAKEKCKEQGIPFSEEKWIGLAKVLYKGSAEIDRKDWSTEEGIDYNSRLDGMIDKLAEDLGKKPSPGWNLGRLVSWRQSVLGGDKRTQ
jgi:hypothetical protein